MDTFLHAVFGLLILVFVVCPLFWFLVGFMLYSVYTYLSNMNYMVNEEKIRKGVLCIGLVGVTIGAFFLLFGKSPSPLMIGLSLIPTGVVLFYALQIMQDALFASLPFAIFRATQDIHEMNERDRYRNS